MTNLIVPSFIWYEAPYHHVTAILPLLKLPVPIKKGKEKNSGSGINKNSGMNEGKEVPERPQQDDNLYGYATGCITGNIVIWRFLKGKDDCVNLFPQVFITSQDTSPVLALFEVMHEFKPSILSVTKDGSIAIYSMADGQCLAGRTHVLKCFPTTVKVFENRFIVAGGRTTEVEILDIANRKVIKRIEKHDTWIRDIAVGTIKNCPTIGVLSGSGLALFFHIPAEMKQKKNPTTGKIPLSSSPSHSPSLSGSVSLTQAPVPHTNYEETVTKPMEFPDSISMVFSPSSHLLLVLFTNNWEIFETKGQRMLARINVIGSSIIHGHFLGEDLIVIWMKDGRGIVYKLPTDLFQDFLNSTPAPSAPAVDPSSLMKDQINKILFSSEILFSSSTVEEKVEETTQKVEETSDSKKESPTSYVEKLDPIGGVHLHGCNGIVNYVNSLSFCTTNEYLSVGFDEGQICVWELPLKFTDHSSIIPPTTIGRFHDGWYEPRQPRVTASLILEEQFILVTGHSDGSLTMQKLPTDDEPISWFAHSAKINCLLNLKTTVDYLITGSDDYYVKVWSIGTRRLISRFSYHSGPVRSFYSTDAEKIPDYWKNRFFSISDDRSVILYQMDYERGVRSVFGPHTVDIVDVKWIVDQDYLLVSCLDGSVSIWEMDSGALEQRVHGKVAADMFANASPLAKIEKQETIQVASKQSISAFTIEGSQLSYGSPIQGLIFNIKNLSADLKGSSQNDSFNWKTNSFLLPWGHDENLDKTISTELKLNPPNCSISYGLTGTSGRMSILVPKIPADARWTISDTLTALHTLAITSLCTPLNPKNMTNAHGQILSHVCALIPEQVEGYIPPSLSFLARYWHDPLENIMQSSRTIFASVIDKYSEVERRAIAQTWFDLFTLEENNKAKELVILVLGILGSERPDSLPDHTVKPIANGILSLLLQESTTEKLRVAAAEILGKGFSKWRTCLDPNEIIGHLTKLSTAGKSTQKTLSDKAHLAILLIGQEDPALFLKTIGKPLYSLAKLNEAAIADLIAGLQFVGSLIRKFPASLLSVLPNLIELLVSSLNPHPHGLRTACLQITTALIHELVHKYPMIAFNHHSQKLAVGSHEGSIIVFDLISATPWNRVDKAHSKEITSLTWDDDGEKIASYSIEESRVKIFEPKTNFFLGSKLSLKKEIVLPPASKIISKEHLLDHNSISNQFRFQFTARRTLMLVRPWEKDSTTAFEF